MDDDCVPPDQAGPKVRGVEFMSEEEMIDPGSPRPEKWKKLNAIVVPHGVQPREMTIYWAAPDAVTLELPEPEDFVDKLISRGSPAPPARNCAAGRSPGLRRSGTPQQAGMRRERR